MNVTMDERQNWNIIAANISKFTPIMLTIPKGMWVDVYRDSAAQKFSFSHPDGDINVKFCRMTCPDLEGSYAIEKRGERYFSSDEEEIPASQLPEVLAQYIKNMKSDGAEWGWEFKF